MRWLAALLLIAALPARAETVTIPGPQGVALRAALLLVYPGAYHDFDIEVPVRVLRNIPSSQRDDGTVHVGGDPAARADALVRVPAFLVALPPR